MGPRPHIRLNLALLQGYLCREQPRFRRVRCRRLRLVQRLWCWLPRPWCPLRRKESEPGNKRAAAERGEFALCLTWELGVWIPLSMILFDAGCGTGGYRGSDQGESGGYSSQFSVPSQILNQRIVEVYDGFEEDADRPRWM